jgi:DNA polymerase-3 subunit alpha
MFGEVEEEQDLNPYDDYVNKVRDWTPKQKLTGEKDTLGLFVTGHPFDEYEKEVRNMAKTKLSNIQASKSTQKVAGIIVAQRVMKTKRGGNMAILTIDDRSGRLEVRMFSETYDKYRDKMIVDQLVVLEVEVKHDSYNDSLGANVNQLWTITEARTLYCSGNAIELKHKDATPKFINALSKKLEPFNIAGAPVVLKYEGEQASAQIKFGDKFKVQPTDELLYRLKEELGNDNVTCLY